MRGRVILKEALNEDARMALLDARGFAALDVLTRLTVNADADGRFIAEAESLPGLLYPKRPTIRNLDEFEGDLNAMANAGIVRLYQHNGVRYGQLLHWFQQQPKPDQRWYSPSKIPAPRGFRGHWTWEDATRESRVQHARITRATRVQHARITRGPRENHAQEVEVEVEVGRTSCLSSDSKEETESSERPRASRKKRATASDSEHQQIIDHIHDSYEAKTGTPPEMPFKQIAVFVKHVRKTRTADQIMAVWDHWLSSEDPWAKEHAWAWNQFQPNWNAVELALKEGRPYGRTERTAHKRPRLDTLPDPPEAFGAGGPFKL